MQELWNSFVAPRDGMFQQNKTWQNQTVTLEVKYLPKDAQHIYKDNIHLPLTWKNNRVSQEHNKHNKVTSYYGENQTHRSASSLNQISLGDNYASIPHHEPVIPVILK